ncbi:sigma-70 family RNA polymerase sigma factor [Beduinella massiliensis]|uniref:sigma-70 family RNA polymerase sigma factor n=1 Tax=Beduinella massiliensis TaxID=1852363 RepID=UPI000C8497EF
MSDEERERLILDNTKLVWYVVRRLYGHSPAEKQEELYHYGLEGLVKAARDFDPERGVKFGTMAYPYIRNALGHGARREFGSVYLPVYKRQAYSALLYGDGIPAEIAPDEARTMQALGEGLLSLDTEYMADRLGGEDQELERAEQRADVERLLGQLKSRERYVIVHRLAYGEKLRQVAEALGLSRERVRQIEKRAMEKLREG